MPLYCPVPHNKRVIEVHLRNLRHVIMSRLLSMRARLPFAMDNYPAHLTLDCHGPCVRIVVLRLQHAAQVLGPDEDFIVIGVPHALIEFRWAVGVCVWRFRGTLHNSVVVDAGVDENAARRLAFVEAIYSERLGKKVSIWKVEFGRGGEAVPGHRCCIFRCRSAAREYPSL